jgi:O-antigen ligase
MTVRAERLRAMLWGALVLHAFCLPWTMTGMQGLLIVVFVLQGAVWIAERRIDWRWDPLAAPVLLFLAATAVAVAFSLDPALSARKAFQHAWTIPVYFVAMEQLRGRTDRARLLLTVLVLTTGVVAIYGIVQHYFGIDALRIGGNDPRLYVKNGDYFHSVGFFDHHLTYGNQVMMVLLLAAGLFVPRPSRRMTIALVVATALALVAFFFSYARGPILGLGAGLLFLGYLKGPRALAVAAAAGLAIGGTFYAASPTLRDRIDSSFRGNQNVERIITWQTSIDVIRDHPWTGVGPGVYRRIIMDYRRGYNVSFTSRSHAHNAFLQVLAAQGIVGFLPFLWMLTRLFAIGIGRYYSCGPGGRAYRETVRAGLAAMVAFCVAGLFQNNFEDGEVAMLFWLLAAVVLRGPDGPTASEEARP